MDLSLHTHTLAEADRDPLPPMAGPALKLVGGSDAHCAPTSQRHDGTEQKAASRLRARIGETVAELRSFPRQLVTEIKAPANAVLLIVPIEGKAVVVTESGHEEIDTKTAIVLARPVHVSVAWLAGSRGLILHLPRPRLQALASARFGGARRIASTQRTISIKSNGELTEALTNLLSAVMAPDSACGDEHALHGALVARLAERYGVDELFPQSRSITLAMRQIEEHCERAWDAESLAAATGVTVPTLRRGFRACLGTSIGTFIQQARLQWAYTCLASGHDSRQMTAIAESVGYRTAGSFSRAYQKRFGESPSQTRVRGVHSNNGTTKIDI